MLPQLNLHHNGNSYRQVGTDEEKWEIVQHIGTHGVSAFFISDFFEGIAAFRSLEEKYRKFVDEGMELNSTFISGPRKQFVKFDSLTWDIRDGSYDDGMEINIYGRRGPTEREQEYLSKALNKAVEQQESEEFKTYKKLRQKFG